VRVYRYRLGEGSVGVKPWRVRTAIASVVLLSIAGCAASDAQSDPATSQMSSTAPQVSVPASASESPDPALTTTYALGSETVARISRDGAVLQADRGQVTVSGAANTGIRVAVVANDQAGRPTWTLDFDVTPQGRVEAGELVTGGVTWAVLAQTGLVTSQINDQLVDLQTDRAVTMRTNPTGGANTPVTFRVVGQKG
jgi:hypothetical protein